MGAFSLEPELSDYDSTTTILGILVAVFSWTTLYFILCLINSKCSYEWNCRIVSTLHAVVVVFMSYWCGFVQGTWPFTDIGSPNSKLQHWTCVVCLGYFVWDMIWCLYFQTEDGLMLFHHVLSLYGNAHVLVTGFNAVAMIGVIFGSEMSNPFLQCRWFIRETKQHHTWYTEVNDLMFMFLFGSLRIGVGTYFLYTTLMNPLSSVFVNLGAIAIYTVSWCFWVMIVRYAIRKYTKKMKKWKSQSNESSNQTIDAKKNESDTSNIDVKQRHLLSNGQNNNVFDVRNGVDASHVYENGHTSHTKQD